VATSGSRERCVPPHLWSFALEKLNIRQITSSDSEWIKCLLRDHWGSAVVVSRGKLYYADQLSGFVATEQDEKIGLITYSINGTECEIVTLNSVREDRGVGSALLKAVESVARHAGCACLRLITTNDNLKALRFYQRRGFLLVAVHRNAVERSRALKPEIPVTGNDGIPIRDELELELPL
jgi:ribosomal protein S18 acetylase RimI-like enzyme